MKRATVCQVCQSDQVSVGCKICKSVFYCDSPVCQQHYTQQHIQSHANNASNSLESTLVQLWIEHVDYTHTFLVAAIRALPKADVDAYRTRLLDNQRHLARAIPVPNQNTLHKELVEHIVIAERIVQSVEIQSKFDQAVADWRANGRRVARALHQPGSNVSLKAINEAMTLHLNQTLAEATALLTQDMTRAIKRWDEARQHMIQVAILLANRKME